MPHSAIKRRGGFTRKTAKIAYKTTERGCDQVGEWLSPRAARRYAGVHKSTLWRWLEFECSIWGGRKPSTRRLPDGFGRESTFVLRTDLDQILSRVAQPTAEDDESVRIQLAAARLGVTAARCGFNRSSSS